MDVVEVGAQLLDPGVVDRPRADVDPELVPLAEVPGLDDPLDDDAVGLDPVRGELLAACASSSSKRDWRLAASSVESLW